MQRDDKETQAGNREYATLILVRHGQSLYNEKNLFTGWTDVELSRQGREEAREAAVYLKDQHLYPDICFTSWLKRAIHTSQIILRELEREYIDSLRSWKLNERHYGAWQQHNKREIESEVGEEMFLQVRRGYDTPPPPLEKDDPRSAQFEEKYNNVDPVQLPASESLKDTKERTLNFFYESIAPQLSRGKTVLVSAHGNSLRSLVMGIEDLTPEEIINIEIPTGVLYVYDFDRELAIAKKSILGKGP